MTLPTTLDSHVIAADERVVGRRGSFALWFLIVIFVLSVLIPIFLLANVPDAHRSGAWSVTLAIGCWSGARMAWIIGRGKAHLFEFMFWLFVYIFFGLAATVQMRSGAIPTTTPDIPAQLDWTTALLIAGSLGAFEVGRLCAGRDTSDLPAQNIRRLAKINPVSAWALAIIGAVANLTFVRKQGLASFFQNRTERQLVRTDTFSAASTGFVLSALSWIPLLVAAGAFVWLRKERKSKGLSGRYGWVIAACIVGVLIVINPISGARFTSGTVLFALVSYLGIFNSHWRVRVSLSGVIAGFIFVFPIADAFRTSTINVARPGFFAEYAGNGDYDAIWQVSNSIFYVRELGITWGRQLLGVALFWIPRTSWPNKPIDTGTLLANFRTYAFTNLSAPLWAEAVINGGVVFAIITPFILGIVVVKVDRRLPNAFRSGGRSAIVGAILPAYMIIILRGSLLQASGSFFLMLASFIILGLGTRKRDRAALLASAPE